MMEREGLIAVYRAALAAVDPYALVCGVDLSQAPPHVLALGKAAVAMARGALDQRPFREMLVVAPERPENVKWLKTRRADGTPWHYPMPFKLKDGTLYSQLQGSHPVPDQRSLDAGEAILEFAQGAREGLLVLLSGGGSALAEALPEGLTLDDLRRATQLMLAGGVPIEQVNAVRRHLSRLKGGRLALLTPCHTLALSDVIGSPPEAIASGPTAPDPSTVEDALEFGRALPEHVLRALRETPKPGDPCFEPCTYCVLADNSTLAQAASEAFEAELFSTALEGEARELARQFADMPPGRWVASGEPTVTLRDKPGKGGRCQELALAFALLVEGCQARLLAAGSDGIDGPTDAAGAIVDGTTCARARSMGLDPEHHLRTHDAYPLLEAVGALLKPGPTGTNANDLFLLERE